MTEDLTEANVADMQARVVKAIKSAGADVLGTVQVNVEDFLENVAGSAVEAMLLGTVRDQRHARAQVMLAKLRAKIELERTVLDRIADIVHIGGAFASSFLGLNVGKLLGGLIPTNTED